MRVKDAFDVLEQAPPPVGVTLERVKSTVLHVTFPLPKDTRSDLEVFTLPLLLGIAGGILAIFFYQIDFSLFAVFLFIIGASYLIKMAQKLERERSYTALLFILNAKGGDVHRVDDDGARKLEAYYRWGELKAVSIKNVPKSKEDPPPYYIHLETKGPNVRLFQGSLSTDEISYTASMIEALLNQRYRGKVPINWKRSLEVLGEPLIVDWSEHLIDDE